MVPQQVEVEEGTILNQSLSTLMKSQFLFRITLAGFLVLASTVIVFRQSIGSRGSPHAADTRSDTRRRSLFYLGSRQCSLGTDVTRFRYNATSQLYVPIFNDTDSTNASSHQDRQLQMIRRSFDLEFPQEDGAVEAMRACWCATAFFGRPMEYCPAIFDTCSVEGTNGPVLCYHTSGADSFIRSFWPVGLFWIVALLYALWCSESGGSARDFITRKLCLKSCTQFSTEEEALTADLRRMLDHQPERAAFLYRHAILRARQHAHQPRRTRQQQHQFSPGRNFVRRGNDRTEAPTTNRHSDDDDFFLENFRDVLALKTKTFQDEEGSSSPTSNTNANLAALGSPLSLSSMGNTMQRVPSVSWLPSSFHREQVTLEQMDDQLEQGIRCAICLTRLRSGETIGDIPCGHVFHKDCLKDWLVRKNRCPICQQTGIARIRSMRITALSDP